MELKIIKGLPPNIELIRAAGFEGNEDAVYTYGNKIYSLTKKEIPPDILEHEKCHSRQQGSNPDWYISQWLTDRDFRRDSEVEAYCVQLNWIRENMGAKAAKEGLDELAENLASDLYKLGIDFHKAHSLIRHRAQEVV